MESDKTFWIIVIVTVSTLVTILTPVESISLRDSFLARSLLPLFESPSSAPAPGPIMDSPAPSLEDSTDYSDYAADGNVVSPAPSPADCGSPVNPPANPPTKADVESPAASPEAPASSPSANPPTKADVESPAASPEAPASSPSANPPAEENPVAPSPTEPSGLTLMSSSSPKNLLNQPLLSPEIKTICGKTDNPPLCESSISPLLTAETKPDASSILVLAIQASVNATKAAMATVEKVSATECKELYDDAVTNLEDAINSVKSRDIPTVNTNLSAAMTDYGTCNDGFEETGEPNPLADVSDKLTKMVSNCLAISTLIK